MVNHSELVAELQSLLENGHEISTVSPLRAFQEPKMDGVAVTDWLIIYEIMSTGMVKKV